MKNKIDVIQLEGQKYFRLAFENKTFLTEWLSARYPFAGTKDEDAIFDFEIQRNGSIVVEGIMYDSDYTHYPIYCIRYSEISSYSTIDPTLNFCASYLEEGDVLVIDTGDVTEGIAEYIENSIKSRLEA